MELGWPAIHGELMTQLRLCFTSPRQLHYGFDDESGARELVEMLMKGWPASNIATAVEQLCKWHVEGTSAVSGAKRVARDRLSESLLGQHTVPAGAVSEAFEKLAYSNPLALLPAVERARKARAGNIDPATRAADERAAKTRYALQLYNFLVEAKAPIVKILQEVSDPEEACVRIFGTRRSKTLRNRYHSWANFCTVA